jgi:hypothetical protein
MCAGDDLPDEARADPGRKGIVAVWPQLLERRHVVICARAGDASATPPSAPTSSSRRENLGVPAAFMIPSWTASSARHEQSAF